MGKKRKMSAGLWAFLSIAVLVIGLFASGVLQKVGDGSGFGDDESCLSTTSPTLTIKAYDKETGTALTEATNLYRLVGDRVWTSFTAGTGFAIDAGDEIEYVMGISTTDFTDNAYGSYVKSYTVPCKETPSVQEEMVNDEVETSLTATFYNADSDAAAETFLAGQTQDVSVKLQAGVKEYFGNPYEGGNSNVIVLNLNTTEWDTPEKVSIGGVELSKVSVPQRHSAVAGMISYAYELPVITDTQIEVTFKLNADDTTAPATDMTAHIYAGNNFYNADTQVIEFGVENEEGVAVGTDASDTVVFDFTA